MCKVLTREIYGNVAYISRSAYGSQPLKRASDSLGSSVNCTNKLVLIVPGLPFVFTLGLFPPQYSHIHASSIRHYSLTFPLPSSVYPTRPKPRRYMAAFRSFRTRFPMHARAMKHAHSPHHAFIPTGVSDEEKKKCIPEERTSGPCPYIFLPSDHLPVLHQTVTQIKNPV